MSSLPKTFLTEAEYLEQERRAEFKSEYYKGEVFAMAGVSRRHALIVLSIGAELRARLKGRPCEVYMSDLRLRVSPTGLYTYPDVMVVCGSPQFAEADTLLNPSIIIEVLSDSTTDYDHGRKFLHYRNLPSLTDYLMVAQHTPHVEHYIRQPDNRWTLGEFRDLAQCVPLVSLDCVLPLSEIYYQIDFGAEQRL